MPVRVVAVLLPSACVDSGGLEMAVAYASERVQFGRRIGSFQSIQHLCAEQLVSVEAARSTPQVDWSR